MSSSASTTTAPGCCTYSRTSSPSPKRNLSRRMLQIAPSNTVSDSTVSERPSTSHHSARRVWSSSDCRVNGLGFGLDLGRGVRLGDLEQSARALPVERGRDEATEERDRKSAVEGKAGDARGRRVS